MSILEIILIAVGLSMDAFAVSIAGGARIGGRKLPTALKMGLFFGGFQMIMPLAGWSIGMKLKQMITQYDHWVAFVILAFIGGKMIFEALRPERRERELKSIGFAVLFFLAIATSIDALAVGLSFAFLKIFIAKPVLIIGAVTFSFSFAGVFIGSKIGAFLKSKTEIAGGVILIGIGAKILIEHLVK